MTTNRAGPSQHIIDNQPDIIKKFRRCHMKGCLGTGNWSPLIKLSPDGRQYAFMRLRLLLVCDHHQATIGLEDLIYKPIQDGRQGWEVIQGAFRHAGKDIPEKEFTRLEWELS